MSKANIIIQTEDVQVRIMELGSGETVPLHHHSEITDTMFGLTGEIMVCKKTPEEQVVLTPGKHCVVAAGRTHQVRNRLQQEPSRYLLVQGVGTYDFIKDPM